jgi:hypothetical protein
MPVVAGMVDAVSGGDALAGPGGVPGTFTAALGGFMLMLLGYPVVLSCLCRVRVLIADAQGIRFPLMGPRLP